MKKLKQCAVALAASKGKMEDLAAPAKKKKVQEKGKFEGKVVRIVTDRSHLCGILMEVKSHLGKKLMGQSVFKDTLKDFIDGSGKVPHQICCDEQDVIDVAEIAKADVMAQKPLKFNQLERVEMELKFNPIELQDYSSFVQDPRFGAIHMNMWYWLLCRDFDIQKDAGFVWINSEEIAATCQELDSELGGESFTRVVGQFAAKLRDAKHVFVPVWGGTYGGGDQHWTWMFLDKKDDGKWVAQYKDSLESLHKDCWENGEKLLTVFAVAVNDYELKMPKDRLNAKMQPRGHPLCGQFVCHWTDEKIREILGYGPCSIGHPNIRRINERIEKMQTIIVQNQGFAKIHAKKMEKMKQQKEEEAAKDAKALKALAQSQEFLEKTKIQAGFRILVPWATSAGCAKC